MTCMRVHVVNSELAHYLVWDFMNTCFAIINGCAIKCFVKQKVAR